MKSIERFFRDLDAAWKDKGEPILFQVIGSTALLEFGFPGFIGDLLNYHVI